jgi:hypothetical protein
MMMITTKEGVSNEKNSERMHSGKGAMAHVELH